MRERSNKVNIYHNVKNGKAIINIQQGIQSLRPFSTSAPSHLCHLCPPITMVKYTHVIKRISNGFSFHTMYCETRYETRGLIAIWTYVSRVRTQLTKVKIAISVRGRRTEARGTSIHNTSYEMTIHLRSYFYTASKALLNQFDQRDMYSV